MNGDGHHAIFSPQEPRSGVRAALGDIHGVHLMYVAEIVPPAETAVVAFEGGFVPDSEEANNGGASGDLEMSPLRGSIQRASFRGLKSEGTYTVKVRTVVNGKTICQVAAEIKEDKEDMPTETKEAPV